MKEGNEIVSGAYIVNLRGGYEAYSTSSTNSLAIEARIS